MEIIALLRKERQVLVDRIAQIDNMLQQYDQWGREAERLLTLTASAISRDRSDLPAYPKSAEREAGTPPTEVRDDAIRLSSRVPAGSTRKTPIKEFENAVIEVLTESAVPMDRIALYDALSARGIVIGDGNRDKELNALSARVYRMAEAGRLVNERGRGYSLAVGIEGDVSSEPGPGGPVVHELGDI